MLLNLLLQGRLQLLLHMLLNLLLNGRLQLLLNLNRLLNSRMRQYLRNTGLYLCLQPRLHRRRHATLNLCLQPRLHRRWHGISHGQCLHHWLYGCWCWHYLLWLLLLNMHGLWLGWHWYQRVADWQTLQGRGSIFNGNQLFHLFPRFCFLSSFSLSQFGSFFAIHFPSSFAYNRCQRIMKSPIPSPSMSQIAKVGVRSPP